MEKVLDLSASVHTLCEKHPELPSILQAIGFTDITKPGMLNTAGRFMTLPKGAAMKKIPMEMVLNCLREAGYKIVDED